MSLDDDRRDIALLGDIPAIMLNRIANRYRGADPFEVSGDAITRHKRSDPVGTLAKESTNKAAVHIKSNR